ncbi:hypothetical protein [Microcoleus sp. T3_D1]|uniref:hypothetical protein n=1 Tax=Microcoleus sp. T3_D1 TaxID=3055427 RepID=UPI002FD57D86
MPVPQENLLFVEQASCLFLRMVQDVSRSDYPLPISVNLSFESVSPPAHPTVRQGMNSLSHSESPLKED